MKQYLTLNKLILLLLLLFPLLSFKETLIWEDVEIDSTMSVRFPGKPTFYTVQNLPMYAIRTPEALFMAMVLIDEDMTLDKNPVKNEQNLNTFYKGLMSAMAEDQKGIVVDTASFYLSNYRGIDFSITSFLPNGNQITRYTHAILIQDKTYTLMITPLAPSSKESRAMQKQFFESLKIK